MILLDTEPMTVLEREGPDAGILKARLAKIPLDDLATAIISYEEQTRGWLAYIARLETEAARIQAYRLLNRHLEVYCRVAIVPYDEKAAAPAAEDNFPLLVRTDKNWFDFSQCKPKNDKARWPREVSLEIRSRYNSNRPALPRE